jgi:HK97 family phage portal protein
MGFLFPTKRASLADFGVPSRRSGGRAGSASSSDARRLSAVWAAIDIRASLESTLPVDCFRHSAGSSRPVEIPTPQVLITPDEWADGTPMSMTDWLYASRADLDQYGNAIGVITQRDGNGLPRQIHLVSANDVTVIGKGGRVVKYRIGSKEYEPREIWHERQYIQAGSPLGLSPIAHAARTIKTQGSALSFALDWFDRGATPSMILRNTRESIAPKESDVIKRRVLASMQDGEPAVVGKDWEVELQNGRAKDIAFLELMNYGNTDLARFFGVPADMIDAAVSGSSITYANLAERMLHFLILRFGPAVIRREKALSQLVPNSGFVKLATDGLLRLDPDTRRRLLIEEVEAGLKTKDEARALENLPPLDTSSDLASSTVDARAIAEVLQKGYLAVVNGVITPPELRELANEAGGNLTLPGPFPATPPTQGAP